MAHTVKNNFQLKIRKYLRPILVIVGFIIIGIIILISVRAATNYISSEAELGTSSDSGMYTGADDKASGEQYVRFGADNNKGGGGGVTVSGNQILRNGKPFLMRGFNMRGLLGFPACDNNDAILSGKHFNEEEMFAAKDKWKANTLRFQISQPGLTRDDLPEDDFDRYVNEIIVPRVKLASSHGFVIILSMQTESRACPKSGTGNKQPSQFTIDAWNRVVPAVKAALSPASFNNVVFELFNEPRGDLDAASWAQWKDGGQLPIKPGQNNGETPIGHQNVLNAVRSAGANKNLIIAEGMDLGTNLAGVPMLDDPASGPDQIAYAIHGYRYANQGNPDADRQAWEKDYGFLTATKPVLQTEWSYGAKECKTYKETLAPDYLQYLADKNIGIFGSPFDDANAGGLIYDWNWTPTDCNLPDYLAKGGSGLVVHDIFADLANEDSK